MRENIRGGIVVQGFYDGTVGGAALLILHIAYGLTNILVMLLCCKDIIDEVM